MQVELNIFLKEERERVRIRNFLMLLYEVQLLVNQSSESPTNFSPINGYY